MTILIKPRYMFAIGASLALLKNVQLSLIDKPHVIDEMRIPFVGPVEERGLDATLERGGWINVPMHWDSVDKALWNAFVPLTWGSWLVNSKLLYATWLDESGYYSAYSVVLDRPLENKDYKVIPGNDRIRTLKIKGNHWLLQSLVKSANYTVTTSDRLIYGDTTSGNKTMTLPAAATPQPYTAFSFWNQVGANSLIVASADLIDGAASVSLAAGVRADFYSNGATWKRVIYYT